MDTLNQEILSCGRMALASYKTKNQLLAHTQETNAGNFKFVKAECRRMIQFIHYNLSTHIFSLKNEQDQIASGQSILKQIYKQETNLVTD